MLAFISTFLNEEKELPVFLDSLLNQSMKPDEIILVDAGSKDRSGEIIKKYSDTLNIKVILKKGNRSKGRNTAIKNSKGDVIICSDVGCILDRNFIKNIASPFKDKKIDVVSGFYHPKTRNTFEESLSAYTSVMPDKIDPRNFLPSSRSIAFRKSAWKKIGGYPEELDYCEDLVFAKRLKNENFKFLFVKEAFVYWPQRKSIIEAFIQFFNYATGDGTARYFRLPQVPILYIRFFFLLLAVPLFIFGGSLIKTSVVFIFILYLLWSIEKNYSYVKNVKALIYLPLLQITSDVAVFTGMSFGLIKSFLRPKQ